VAVFCPDGMLFLLSFFHIRWLLMVYSIFEHFFFDRVMQLVFFVDTILMVFVGLMGPVAHRDML